MKLPDCMLPDGGADPCEGFTETYEAYRRLRDENERLRGALHALLACPHIADRDPHPWHEPETEVAVSLARAALDGEK